MARTDLFSQPIPGRNDTVRDILVVITDSGSDDDIAVPTYALKEDGVTIFSVGIDRYVRGQLNEMASEPDSEHVFTIDIYDELGPTMAPLKDAIIRGWYRQTSVSVKEKVSKLIFDFVAHGYYAYTPKYLANKGVGGFTLDNWKTSQVQFDNCSPTGTLSR